MIKNRSRDIALVLVLLLTLLLAACAKEVVAVVTWQDQFDLGMKYLQENNYEEAILAFTAAIEIDPKQIDPYLQLVEVYLATGDREKAEEIRKQGFEATEDVRLEAPIDVELTDEMFGEMDGYQQFDSLGEEEREFILTVIDALRGGEVSVLNEMAKSTHADVEAYTMIDGKKVHIVVGVGKDQSALNRLFGAMTLSSGAFGVMVESREENGQGYCYGYGDSFDTAEGVYGASWQFLTGRCTGWQFNGPFRATLSENVPSEEIYASSKFSGTAVNNVLQPNQVEFDITAPGYALWRAYEKAGDDWALTDVVYNGETYAPEDIEGAELYEVTSWSLDPW